MSINDANEINLVVSMCDSKTIHYNLSSKKENK